MNRVKGLFKVRKISLMRLIAGIVLGVLGICAVILLIFSKMSMNNLLEQEIENRQALLQLNVENVNGTLDSLQGYLYQHFTNSEEITMLETGTNETDLFMAKQSLTRNLQKIAGWNEALKFLFFYSPDSVDHVTVQVSNRETDFTERKDLEQKIVAIAHCNCEQRAKDFEKILLEKMEVKKSIIVDTAGISSMYANDGGIIVAI